MRSKYTSIFARLLVLVFFFMVGTVKARAEEEYGIFERSLEATGSFNDTAAALDKALAESKLTLHAKRDLVFNDKVQQARVYIGTSPAFMEAAKDESPDTISAQILRIGVYEYGAGKKSHIDITNPVDRKSTRLNS